MSNVFRWSNAILNERVGDLLKQSSLLPDLIPQVPLSPVDRSLEGQDRAAVLPSQLSSPLLPHVTVPGHASHTNPRPAHQQKMMRCEANQRERGIGQDNATFEPCRHMVLAPRRRRSPEGGEMPRPRPIAAAVPVPETPGSRCIASRL